MRKLFAQWCTRCGKISNLAVEQYHAGYPQKSTSTVQRNIVLLFNCTCMQLLNQISVNRAARGEAVIQLLQGNLTAIPPEHAADILVISAYPGSYVPVPHTLIAGLYEKGIDVAMLAKHKEIDLREQLGCWLSAPLTNAQQHGYNFKNDRWRRQLGQPVQWKRPWVSSCLLYGRKHRHGCW